MTLNDVCKLIVDCPHTTAPDEGIGIPLIRTPNIGKGRFELEGVHRVSDAVYQERISRAVPQDDDIIFAREAPVGNAAIIKHGQKMCLGQRTVLIRPDAKKVCPDYLVYYILAPLQQYKLLGTANGATVAHVNLPMIRGMNVDNLPPLREQRRIADILSAYDDLIENNRKQIKLLEEAAQRLYKEWFIDLHFPGYEHTKIINGIPEGWKRVRLDELFTYKRGISYSSKDLSESNCLLVNLKNIKPWGGYNHNLEKFYSGKYTEKDCLKEGDLIMGVTDMTSERRLVGQVALVPNSKKDLVFSMDIIKIEPYSIRKEYLYAAFHYGNISTQIAPLANGVNVLHLKPDSMMGHETIIPSESLMNTYAEFFRDLHARKECAVSSSIEAAKFRDDLLPKLMNGGGKVSI